MLHQNIEAQQSCQSPQPQAEDHPPPPPGVEMGNFEIIHHLTNRSYLASKPRTEAELPLWSLSILKNWQQFPHWHTVFQGTLAARFGDRLDDPLCVSEEDDHSAAMLLTAYLGPQIEADLERMLDSELFASVLVGSASAKGECGSSRFYIYHTALIGEFIFPPHDWSSFLLLTMSNVSCQLVMNFG